MTVGFFDTIERVDGETVIVKSSMRLMAFITTIVGCLGFIGGGVGLFMGLPVNTLLTTGFALAGSGEAMKWLQKKEEARVGKVEVDTGVGGGGPGGASPASA